MRRLQIRPTTLFKIFVAAASLALGLAAAGLWPRGSAVPPAPPAVAAAPARAEVTVRDTYGRALPDSPRRFEGRYENFVYGFSVEIPAGMVGSGSAPPAPDHGFGIDLDDPRSTAWNGRRDFPQSYLYVDGSYNSYDWERLNHAVESHWSFLRKKGATLHAQNKTPTRLGGLRAVRAVAYYDAGGVVMVSDAVFAFGDGASPVYTLSLSTPLAKYERDRPVLEEMLKGWRLQPVR